jgi:hypothetical protein
MWEWIGAFTLLAAALAELAWAWRFHVQVRAEERRGR